MNIYDFVIPIYNEDIFDGNAFLVGNHLISAGHAISMSSSSYFIFDDNKHKFSKCEFLCDDYPHYDRINEWRTKIESENWHDLAILKSPGISGGLQFGEVNYEKECIYIGYDFVSEFDNPNIIEVPIMLSANGLLVPLNDDFIHVSNILKSRSGKLKCGNSGGPLFQEGKVVGVYVGTMGLEGNEKDIFISAEYIKEKIKENEKV